MTEREQGLTKTRLAMLEILKQRYKVLKSNCLNES